MPPLTFAAAFSVSLIGAVIQAVCGFGYGPVNMSLLPYLFPYAQAVALSGLCGSTTAVFVAASSFRYIRWKTVLPCAVTALVFAALSVQLSAGAADGFMVRSLGAALVALGVYSIFFSGRHRQQRRIPRLAERSFLLHRLHHHVHALAQRGLYRRHDPRVRARPRFAAAGRLDRRENLPPPRPQAPAPARLRLSDRLRAPDALQVRKNHPPPESASALRSRSVVPRGTFVLAKKTVLRRSSCRRTVFLSPRNLSGRGAPATSWRCRRPWRRRARGCRRRSRSAGCAAAWGRGTRACT